MDSIVRRIMTIVISIIARMEPLAWTGLAPTLANAEVSPEFLSFEIVLKLSLTITLKFKKKKQFSRPFYWNSLPTGRGRVLTSASGMQEWGHVYEYHRRIQLHLRQWLDRA